MCDPCRFIAVHVRYLALYSACPFSVYSGSFFHSFLQASALLTVALERVSLSFVNVWPLLATLYEFLGFFVSLRILLLLPILSMFVLLAVHV